MTGEPQQEEHKGYFGINQDSFYEPYYEPKYSVTSVMTDTTSTGMEVVEMLIKEQITEYKWNFTQEDIAKIAKMKDP